LRRAARPAPPTDAVPVASFERVTAAYGKLLVLNDVSIAFHARRTVGVVGESGSGKSTAARVLSGLLVPQAGQVTLDGVPLAPRFRDRTKDQLRRIQMIYQMADTALNPKMRVREIIGYPAQFYLGLRGKALDDRVREILSMIDLEPDRFIDRIPSELSGGQKQRIGIGRALAAAPRLIICDEVTSALDQLVAEGILKLLNRLQSELDLSYMFITHDIATVRAIADDMVVMQHGRIVEQGTRDAIFAPPHAPYTELLLNSVPEMDPGWLTRVLGRQAISAAG
jgi:peptide/nickel transport system ATP-binding protein